MARLFHTSGTWVPPQYSPSDTTSARSPLAVVQRAAVKERGHLTAALLSRARSAVSRDGCRRFIRLHRALPLTFYADSWGPKITALNQNARVCMQTVRPFLSRDFRFSPRGGSRVGGKLLCALDRGFGLSGNYGNVATSCLKTGEGR